MTNPLSKIGIIGMPFVYSMGGWSIMRHKKPVVVVVDEEPSYLQVWKKVFYSFPCEYLFVSNFDEASILLGLQKVDVLISEVVMSNGTGYELAKKACQENPSVSAVLTTTHDCDLTRFNLNHPHFHILYKPYQSIENVMHFIGDILHRKDPREDTTLDEDSWSENDAYPAVMEWKL